MAEEEREPPVTMEEEAMEQRTHVGLQLNRLIPGFKLQSAEGELISPWHFKEKKNLVLLFFDPRSSSDLEILAELKHRYHELADANAEVLAIASGPYDELKQCVASMDFPFPLLSDSTNEVRLAYGVAGPAVFVADRFGELKMQSKIDEDLDSVLNAVIDTLELADLECPECGVRTWPEE